MRKTMTLTVDPAGDIIVAGPVRPHDPDTPEVFVAKLDNQGTLIWQRRLYPSSAEAFMSGDLQPQVEATEPLRDSVSPQVLEAAADEAERRYTGGPPSRFFGASLVAVGLLSVAAVAVAAPEQGTRSAAASVAATSFAGTAVTGAGSALAAAKPTFQRAAPEPFTWDWLVAAEVPDIEVGYATEPQITPAEIREQTLATLAAGRSVEALVWAQAFVDAEPDHALSYLCLGAALQDLGRAAEAQAAYDQCVRRASRGDASECYNLGGRK